MGRGNLPSEPSLSPPEDETHPETVLVKVGPVTLAVHLEWEGDFDEGSWRSLWAITKVEVDEWDDNALREEVGEEL
jgi:hypothetical protein